MRYELPLVLPVEMDSYTKPRSSNDQATLRNKLQRLPKAKEESNLEPRPQTIQVSGSNLWYRTDETGTKSNHRADYNEYPAKTQAIELD